MRYLITGGAGFIGSHLVERLLQEFDSKVTIIDGHADHITVIDNFSEGKYANLPKDPRLTVYEIDILNDECGTLFKGIDVVFHLAALTRPQWSIVYPEETTHVNVEGTVKVLNHCRDNKVKRVVFVSSSSIYGDQETWPCFEDTSPPNPMCTYALTKLVGEQYCRLYQKLYGLSWNAIRPFNVYGTRMNPKGIYSGAVPKFIDMIKKGLQPSITGTGKQARDYIYIDDTVELIYLMAHSRVDGEVFNCGSGENIPINDLYNKIRKMMGSKIKPNHTPKVYEPKMTLADISKSRRLLNWFPKVSLDEGLKRTIEGAIK